LTSTDSSLENLQPTKDKLIKSSHFAPLIISISHELLHTQHAKYR
jgi:hypothetical protein